MSDHMTSLEPGRLLPQPDTLAGHLWTAGDPNVIDAMVTSALENLELSDANLTDLKRYARERSSGFQILAQTLAHPDDQAELNTTIASLWLELRLEWQRHNEVMNYAAFREMPIPKVAGHGSVCSTILARLEELMLPDYRDLLADQAIRLLNDAVPLEYPPLNPVGEAARSEPHPDTLAGHLWAAGDPKIIDEMVTSAVASLELSNADRTNLRLYARERSSGIQTLAQALGQPEDQPELYTTIASLWLELRFEWQRHNEVMNYAAFQGMPLPEVACHGSVCSAILERLEGLLLPDYREKLADHAVQIIQDIMPN